MISFIVPVYNSEEYLKACICSIQNCSIDSEIILVDDGSTDSSGLLCAELVQKNTNIKYYRKENGGAASARNAGIQYASGQYIVFVDSDDTLDSKWADSFTAVGHRDTDLYVYGMAFDYYDGDTSVRTEILSNKYSGIVSTKEIEDSFAEFFENNTLSSACNKVFRRDIIEKYSIRYNEKMNLYEDLGFVLQYLSHSNSVFFIPAILYHYRLSIDNGHYRTRTSNMRDVLYNLDRLSLSFCSFSNSGTVHSVLSNLYIDTLMSSLMLNSYEDDDLHFASTVYIKNINIVRDELSDANKAVYDMLKNEEYRKIDLMIKWKKIKKSIKKTIKRII